jgi:hypothetical protein
MSNFRQREIDRLPNKRDKELRDKWKESLEMLRRDAKAQGDSERLQRLELIEDIYKKRDEVEG